ncbi:MAG: hypothetical protein K2K72_03140 [Duncaniella sp.]|nr:hypothetical protein [Duncaniella sp.]
MNRSILLSTIIALYAAGMRAEVPVYQDESRPLEERVEDALSRMTLDEKVAMLHAEGKFASAGAYPGEALNRP